MSEQVIFYHVNRRFDAENSRVIAPSYVGIPLRSRRYVNGVRVDDAVYSDSGKVQIRTLMTPTGPVQKQVDKTEIAMKNGSIVVDSSNTKLIEYLREHERCRGSFASTKAKKPVLYYEHNPEVVLKQKVEMIVGKAEIYSKIVGFKSKQELVAWASQWDINFTSDKSLQTCREQLVLMVERNPSKFTAAQKAVIADATTEIVEWEKFGLIKSWRGAAPQGRWSWSEMHRPEDVKRQIMEFDKASDPYGALAEFLKENPEVHKKIRTTYSSITG